VIQSRWVDGHDAEHRGAGLPGWFRKRLRGGSVSSVAPRDPECGRAGRLGVRSTAGPRVDVDVVDLVVGGWTLSLKPKAIGAAATVVLGVKTLISTVPVGCQAVEVVL
jgi:hypothetical protein